MAVPEEIRAVPRPKNTVVVETGKPGPHQYSVKERKKAVYRSGKNPSPRNGATIGHIFNGKFVPKSLPIIRTEPEYLCYGPSALLYSVSSDIFEDLSRSFSPQEACRILTMAMLWVIRPHARDSRLQTLYERSFLKLYFPDVSLSEDEVIDFLNVLGESKSRQQQFFELHRKRAGLTGLAEHDGSIKLPKNFSNGGREFLDYLASILFNRIKWKAKTADIRKKQKFEYTMEDLEYAWRPGTGTDIPKVDDQNWAHTDEELKELLVALGLAKGKPVTYTKPKKVEKKKDDGPKRPRGRPRKTVL